MRTRIPAALFLSLILGVPVSACINTYSDADRPKRRERPSEFISRLREHPEHDRMVSGTPPADPGPDADYKAKTDYAAVLVHRGESRKAVTILEAVEAAHPGEYIVAANLGTAYELSGDFAKAHHWISQGMARNPASHEGTEWLHLRILEARQALARDASWIKTHTVLGLDFGTEATPKAPAAWPKGAHDADDVINALTYQLHERLAFVPAPDPLVAGMLSDLADLLALFRSVDVAIPVYALAMQYRPLMVDLVRVRKERSEEVWKNRHPLDLSMMPLIGGVAAGTLALAGILIWWQRRATA